MSVCECRCDHCLDTDCEGDVCAPHQPGRWIVESRHLPHPMPADFQNEDTARHFVEVLGSKSLTVRRLGLSGQVPTEPKGAK